MPPSTLEPSLTFSLGIGHTALLLLDDAVFNIYRWFEV
jgi:hypothetical protein